MTCEHSHCRRFQAHLTAEMLRGQGHSHPWHEAIRVFWQRVPCILDFDRQFTDAQAIVRRMPL